MTQVLGCDLGGTNVRLKVLHCAPGQTPATVAEGRYRSADHAALESALAHFFSAHRLDPGALAYACVAVAGPVQRYGHEQRAQLTNLPWVVDSAALSRTTGLPQVEIINDFEAVGYGLDALADTDLLTLQEGEPVPGAPRALIGAGTGLGQALLVWHSEGYRVIATEGGHVDFAPADDLQIALLQHLRAQLGRVSYEDVVSGPGLERVYGFLEDYTDYRGIPLTPTAAEPELAAAIGQAAAHNDHPLAAAAVELFLSVFGAQAGNLALTAMARGGVYVAGGIAPKLTKLIAASGFMRAFHNKGPMVHLMGKFPVHVVNNPHVGLAGATALACRRAGAPRA